MVCVGFFKGGLRFVLGSELFVCGFISKGGQNATKTWAFEEYLGDSFFCLHRCNIVLQITMLITMTIIIANCLRFVSSFFLFQ